MRYLFALFILSGCTTRAPFSNNFCYVYKTNLVCSEKQLDGQFVNKDRALSEIKDYEGYVVIPVEDFEKAFAVQ